MADEYKKRYHSRQPELLSRKKCEDCSTTISWISAKVSWILGAKKSQFTGSSLEIVENGARAELYTKY